MNQAHAGTLTWPEGAGVAPQCDLNGNLKTGEQNAAVAEDNTNGVIGIQIKPLSTATYAPSVSVSLATVTGTAKATPGNVMAVKVVNRNAAARYLQLFNSTGATTTVYDQFLVPATSMLTIGSDFFSLNGIYLNTGITWGASTTNGTYTAATAADHDVTIVFK